jgi:hypothetical protein
MTDTEILYERLLPLFRDNLGHNIKGTRTPILKALDEALQESFDQGRREGLDEGRAASNDFRFYIP